MADGTGIEWTDATWNPVTGCSIVSPGCTNCYAMKLAGTRLKHTPSRAGLTVDSKAGPVWNGEVRLNEQWLDQPLRWKRPRRIFVCAHGDLFAENVPDEWIDMVFAVMALAPQHTFQVLTKRAKRMRQYMTHGGPTLQQLAKVPQVGRDVMTANTDWPLPNVWLGVSAERQQEADERIPELLATPAAIRFVSAEPLIGPIDLTKLGGTMCLAHHGACCGDRPWLDALRGIQGCARAGAYGFPVRDQALRGLDWVIVGGESGPSARPMHPAWARSIRDQCVAAGVAFFFKQWGAWGDDTGPLDSGADPIMDGAAQCAVWTGSSWGFYRSGFHVPDDLNGADREWVYRLGKKRAGRLLDGVEHSAFPAVSS